MALRKHDVHDNNQHSTKRTRVTFDVSPQLRRRIKMAADQRDISVGEYLSRILDDVVPEERILTQQRHPVTQKTAQALRRIREQISQNNDGKVFEDSTETIHEMREERSQELDQL